MFLAAESQRRQRPHPRSRVLLLARPCRWHRAHASKSARRPLDGMKQAWRCRCVKSALELEDNRRNKRQSRSSKLAAVSRCCSDASAGWPLGSQLSLRGCSQRGTIPSAMAWLIREPWAREIQIYSTKRSVGGRKTRKRETWTLDERSVEKFWVTQLPKEYTQTSTKNLVGRLYRVITLLLIDG